MSKLFIYCNYSIIFNDLLYWYIAVAVALPSQNRKVSIVAEGAFIWDHCMD